MLECTCDWPRESMPCVRPLYQSFCKETGPDEKQKYKYKESTKPTSSYSKFDVPDYMVHNKKPQVYQTVFEPQPVYSFTSTAFNCQGKMMGLHRDPYDCTRFYYCQIYFPGNSLAPISIKHDFICPSGLHFNSKKCSCDWPLINGCHDNNLETLCRRAGEIAGKIIN
jgi:hypothetical protein